MKIKALLFACMLAPIACSDTTAPATIGASGTVAFTYTGAGSTSATTYNATGAIPTNINTTFGSSPWAAAELDNTSQELVVVGVVPRTSTTWDIAGVTISRTTVGSSTINPNCSTSSCTEVLIVFSSSQNEATFTYACALSSGTVTLASLSSTRATGSFSGSGTCVTAAGAASNFTITNGTFDAGITTQLQ